MQPRLQRPDQRLAALLMHGAALLGRAAADLGFHRVEFAEALQRFGGDRRGAGGASS